jgi:hypothetical protein
MLIEMSSLLARNRTPPTALLHAPGSRSHGDQTTAPPPKFGVEASEVSRDATFDLVVSRAG